MRSTQRSVLGAPPARAILRAGLVLLAQGGLICPVWAQTKPPGVPPGTSAEQGTPKTTKPAAEAKRSVESRRHFDNGLKLYRDGNYAGALAEFEAAYDLSPSAGSLRNVALCQKALFRYAESAASLERLLSEHGDALDPKQRRMVEETITELAALVGTVVIQVNPPTAEITIDGRPIPAEERSNGVRLNVGEHTIVASAPAHASLTRTIRVSAEQHQVVPDLVLKPVTGFLVITANDPEAAIAVDGKAVAFQQWSGSVKPGRHLVQIYKEGGDSYEERVKVELGETVVVSAPRDEPAREVSASMTLDTPPPAPPPPEGAQLGWYALASLTVLGVANAPRGLEHNVADDTEIGGVTGGVRAGYRIFDPFAVEALIEGGGFPVRHACDPVSWKDCQAQDAVQRDYQLSTLRLGGNARLFTSGEKLRFTSTIGTGSVRHRLKMRDLSQDDRNAIADSAPDPTSIDIDAELEPERDAVGFNPYFMLELGLQLNEKHGLFEINGTVLIDRTNNTRDDRDGYRPYRGLVFLGLGLRAGWSEWVPRSGSKSRAPRSSR